MNKNVLIITPFYAPETHAAVFRAYKLAKYLKRFGWNPVVLTVDTNYYYKEDYSLLEDVKDIPVYRAHYVEPTIRGLRMVLGGRDRTEKVKSNAVPTASLNHGSSKQSYMQRLYKYVLERWVQVPDRFVTWQKNAINLGKKIIKENNISIVYTTCLPFSTNVIGRELQKRTGVKWVADFRDPITYAKRMYSDYPAVFTKQKKIEQETFKYADAVVGLSEAYMFIFSDFYMGKYDYKCHFIPTGVDDDYIPDNTIVKSENSIVFIGEYLVEYGDAILNMYKRYRSNGGTAKLKIIGNVDINRSAILKITGAADIDDEIEFVGHMPQRELYRLLRRVRACLLIPGKNALWWCNFAKMVDYIALRVPTIAYVPEISEAKAQLEKAGIGIFIKDIEHEDLENLIVQANRMVPNDYCQRYTASRQVRDFIEIFSSLNS